jgi:hypothetical protein
MILSQAAQNHMITFLHEDSMRSSFWNAVLQSLLLKPTFPFFYSLPYLVQAFSMHSLDSLCLSQWRSSHCVSAQIYSYLFCFIICFAVSLHDLTHLQISVLYNISSGLLPVLLLWFLLVLSRVWSVSIEGLWIDDRFYLTLQYSTLTTLYSALLHTHARTHTLVPTAMCSLPLLGSGSQWQTLNFLWVPKLSLASVISFSQQQNPGGHLTHWLANQLSAAHNLSCLQLLSKDHAENTVPLLLFMGCCLVTVMVCRPTSQQRLLYSCLFCSHC